MDVAQLKATELLVIDEWRQLRWPPEVLRACDPSSTRDDADAGP